jgi:hypothetical protein
MANEERSRKASGPERFGFGLLLRVLVTLYPYEVICWSDGVVE